MLLQPRRTKFKKTKKKYLRNQLVETKANTIRLGSIGIKVLESFRFSARQLEAVRQCINRELKRKGKIWLMVFPATPVSGKPTENRMGKGKGDISYWVAPVKAGTVIIEVTGVLHSKARIALEKGKNKLPVKSTIVERC